MSDFLDLDLNGGDDEDAQDNKVVKPSRLVAVPLEQATTLHPLHEQARVEIFGSPDPAGFIAHVCNNRVTLPEDNLPSQMHLPGCLAGMNTRSQWAAGVPFMCILPYVSITDHAIGGAMNDAAGFFLKEQLKLVGMPVDETFFTHLLRFPKPSHMNQYRPAHMKAGGVYARADVLGCQPKVVVGLGSDVLKSFYGKDAKWTNYRGDIHDWHGTKIVPTLNHHQFSMSHGGLEVFQMDLKRAVDVALRGYVPVKKFLDHKVARTVDEVRAFVEEAHLKLDERKQLKGLEPWLAFDTEFGNDVAHQDPWDYCLTLQFSWASSTARLIKFRYTGGRKVFSDEDEQLVIKMLRTVFEREDVRLLGHHLRVDVGKLANMGFQIDEKLGTGLDTMLIHHCLYGSDDEHGLDQLVRKYAPEYGPYWRELEEWLSNNEKSKKLLYGYRDIPDEILDPYALYDADATFAAAEILVEKLRAVPILWDLYWNITAPCSLHLLDVERQGIPVDLVRAGQLRDLYRPTYEAILAELRDRVEWPDFNPQSKNQIAALLFSTTRYKGKDVEKNVPKGAKVLALKPLCDTSKYPKDWAEIEDAGLEELYTPSTKAKYLEIMVLQHPECTELKLLQQLSVLGTFLKGYLADPQINEHGVLEDGGSIIHNVWPDGRARGHLQQMTSTGRYSMRKANLQTSPKKQETSALKVFIERRYGMSLKEYNEKCKPGKDGSPPQIPKDQQFTLPSMKSCYIAPKGSMFIEVDFKTAEVCLAAYASGDPLLIAIIEQGRDIHSETAAKAFELPELVDLESVLSQLKNGDKSAYEHWAEQIKKKHEALRTAAKTVVFGILYGRGAMALGRELQQQGVNVTGEQCQQLIDQFAKTYSTCWAWIQGNMAHAIEHEWVANVYGRRRYFPGVRRLSASQKAAAKRQAANSPIQGSIGDLIAVAGINFYRFRYHTEIGKRLGFKLLVPIHDAFLIECKVEHIEAVKQVIQYCMSDMNTIPGTNGKTIGVDIEVFKRWGEKIKPPEGQKKVPYEQLVEMANAA